MWEITNKSISPQPLTFGIIQTTLFEVVHNSEMVTTNRCPGAEGTTRYLKFHLRLNSFEMEKKTKFRSVD